MPEERAEPREINFRQWLPWTQIFRGFWVALDHKKLLLAAAGILAMSLGWWVLSAAFYSARQGSEPKWGAAEYAGPSGFEQYKRDRARWNLFYEAAAPQPVSEPVWQNENDLYYAVKDGDELTRLQTEIIPVIGNLSRGEVEAKINAGTFLPSEANDPRVRDRDRELAQAWFDRKVKPAGRLRALPWFEDRGPNQFLLITGHAGRPWRDQAGTSGIVEWFVTDQLPVLVEPLVKLLRPVKYFLHPDAGLTEKVYFLLVMLWTVGVWAVFGGAITRIAAVEIARNEKIGLGEALRFTLSRWKSYVFASFFPLLIIAFIVVLLAIFGAVAWIPLLADLWYGLLWFLPILGGLTIAVLLVGLVGWPMIQCTLSAEGSDSFDALSRSYSYVLQKPWSYIWYAAVALAYGAVVVFFVGLMGSLTIYLAKWGVSQLTAKYADPSYMFVWAPTSFGWRRLLLQGTPYEDGQTFPWSFNVIGAFLISVWLYLMFLLIIGFAYSYFWSASTMIYLLMRRKVDDTEMDEVYLEEEDSEEPYSTTAPSGTAAPVPAGSTPPVQLVEPPTLRQPATAATTTAVTPAEGPAPKPGDGEAPPGTGPAS